MLFPDLPADARTWVFTADRPIDHAEQAHLLGSVRRFTEHWVSHGRPVPGEAAFLHDRFLVVAAHLPGGVSGCGIDSMVHTVEEAGHGIGTGWLDGLHVVYRDDRGAIRACARADFRQLVRDEAVTAETQVFVTTIDTLGDLRTGGLERRAGDSWHARTFRLPHPA